MEVDGSIPGVALKSNYVMPINKIVVESLDETNMDDLPKKDMALPTVSASTDKAALHPSKPPAYSTTYRDKMSLLAIFYKSVPDGIGLAGIKYAFNPAEVRWRRTFWLLLVSAGFGVLCYQVTDRCIYYSTYPKSLDVSVEYVDELTFPTVAFCNYNSFRLSQIYGTGMDVFFEDMFYTPTTFNMSSYYSNLTAVNMTDLYDDFGHVVATSVFQVRMNQVILPLQNVTRKIFDWGACFVFNDADGSPGFTVRAAGKSYGLEIMLSVEQYEYFLEPRQRNTAGFHVAVYDRGTFPLIEEAGFVVHPGTHTLVGMDMREVTNLEPPHGECKNKTLNYFDYYGHMECRAECQLDFFVNTCGCKVLAELGNARECTAWEYFTCIIPNFCEYKCDVFILDTKCDCPVPCASRNYDPFLSVARYPSNYYSSVLASQYNVDATLFQDNIVLVSIFFRDMSVQKVSQQIAYSFFSLLCDIGGALGLWLGGSILTVFEVFDLFGHSAYVYSRRGTRGS
ncbi:acid-sensing ion channel 1C-like [Diadema antillarum]|uniref:acid-sensing ion channel 1C-like n=1 Tax=Diadema antillarum TaxID=105358 RepID=UPI003A8862E3